LITLSRSLLRQVRSVFRRAGIGKAASDRDSRVRVETGADGLRLRGMTHDTAVEYHQAGHLPAEQYDLPMQLLDDCEGRKDQPVTLEAKGPNQIVAQFTDGDVPQLLSYPVERSQAFDGFPGRSPKLETNGPELLPALREAIEATDRESTRYALGCLQLRGSQGRIVATDGRQVYRHGGFTFHWTEDLLVPASNVLKCSEFPVNEPLGVGRTEHYVTVVVGPWTVWLRIDSGRFPNLDSIMPDPARATTRVELAPDDIEFLRLALGRLPSHDEDHRPVTLDLNGRVAVRAKGPAAPHPTELVLTGSRVTGEALAINTNRSYLGRAVRLGFQELFAFAADRPVLCDDGRRQYLWSVLDPKDAIPPDERAIRVESTPAAGNQANSGNSPLPVPSHSEGPATPMEDSNANDRPARRRRNSRPTGLPAERNGHVAPTSPTQHAELLHASLREALHKTRGLIVALRRQKKQSRLVETTLASLKQLQGVGE
jgi:hypothetical protein